jgi:uncharacterized protein (TIGR03382 family)
MTLALAAALTTACGARPPPAAPPNGSPAVPGGDGTVVTTALAAPATNLASFSFAQSPDPGLINAPLTVMASLAGVTPAGTPTGTVTFTEFVSGIVLCAGVPVSGGVATCVFTPTDTWPYVAAAYSGDATYPALTDYFSPVVQAQQAVFQSLSASPSPTPSGASFTVSGSLVAQPPATGTVTGNIDLFVDDVWYGYVSTTTGSFSIAVSGIADGEHQVAVAFSDPLFYWDLTSDSFTHWVGTGAPIPSSITVTSGGGQSAVVGKVFASPICVKVLDQNLFSLIGQTVSFTTPASGASASISPAITDIDGAACSTPTANATGGTYTVTARAGSVVTSPGASLTNLTVTSIVAISGTTQSAVVGLPFATPVCARALDQKGAPMAGQLLAFAAPATAASAVLSASAPTNANGVACTSATANTVAGSYAITASSAGVTGSVAILTNTAGAAHHVAYATTGSNVQSATVAAAFGLALGVKVFDVYNNPVPGVTVGWRLRTPTALAKATLNTASAVSNASGQAEATATAGTVTGSYFVDVTVTGLTIDPAAIAFSLTNTAGAPATVAAAASSTPQTATVGGLAFANPLVATVKDLYGNSVPGSTVTFAAPGNGPTVNLSAATRVTDAAGLAQVTATSGTVAGLAVVTASVTTGFTATFSLTNAVGAPSNLLVTGGQGQHAMVGTAFAADLAVTLVDSYGNPVPSITVTWTAPGSGASAQLSATGLPTDSAGKAKVSATARTIAGAYQVTASVPGGIAPKQFNLTNDPGLPATVTAAPLAALQSAEVGTAFARPLAVTVADVHGNPVPGVSVTWAAPASGASAVLSATAASTSAAGIGSVSATAGLVAGSYVVNASVAGVAAPAVFSMVNQHAAPGSIAVVSGSPQQTVVGQPYGAPFEVVVRDGHGNAIPQEVVAFTVPDTGARAALSAPAVQTDDAGHAVVTATAGTIAGVFQVTASVNGVAESVQFALENLSDAPASVAAGPESSGQSTRVGELFGAALSVAVSDQYGNPVPGVAVDFACPPTGASCTLTSSSVLTNPQGQAKVWATAGNTPGALTATATVAGLEPVSYSLTNLVGQPGSIESVAGAAQAAPVFSSFGAPLEVVVKDSYQNAIPGVTVSFTVVTSGAQTAALSAASAVTDASGRAGVTATANGVRGTYSISARVEGAATPATFSLTNQPIPTVVEVDVALPVYQAISTAGVVTHLKVTVGPDAGGRKASGTLSLSSTLPVTAVQGQANVAGSGSAVIATVVDGWAEFDVQVNSWRSQTLTVLFQPDQASAQTWDATSVTPSLRANPPKVVAPTSGCSSGGASGALLPLVLLMVHGMVRRRRGDR